MSTRTVRFHDKQVLLIEDDPASLSIVRNALHKLGVANISSATNAKEAYQLCQQVTFNIVISDLNLGHDQENGLQLLERLRTTDFLEANCVYLIISGESQRPNILGKAELQPDDYLLKPFNMSVLGQRIERAITRRASLKPLYQALADKNIKMAIQACQEEITKGGRHRQYCSLVMTELLWREGDYQAASKLLRPLMEDSQLPWAVIAMAKTQLYLRQFTDASELAKSILANRGLAADAHEVLAQCLLRTEQLEEACIEVKEAIDMAPYSIERQYLGCEIAQENEDFEFAKSCCLAIMEQSRHSIHQNIAHLCNYIRSILDLAEHTDSQTKQRDLQQQALTQIERERNSELVKQAGDFDIDAFKKLVHARIEVTQGRMLSAKQSLAAANKHIETYQEFPLALSTDSLNLLSKMGEFSQLEELLNHLNERGFVPEKAESKLYIQLVNQAADKLSNYNLLISEAKDEFAAGRYQKAYHLLKKAQVHSPVSSDVLLPLIEVIVKLQASKQKPDFELSKELRQLQRLATSLPLSESEKGQLEHLSASMAAYLHA